MGDKAIDPGVFVQRRAQRGVTKSRGRVGDLGYFEAANVSTNHVLFCKIAQKR